VEVGSGVGSGVGMSVVGDAVGADVGFRVGAGVSPVVVVTDDVVDVTVVFTSVVVVEVVVRLKCGSGGGDAQIVSLPSASSSLTQPFLVMLKVCPVPKNMSTLNTLFLYPTTL